MNTPEADKEQVDYLVQRRRDKAKKKMDKLEKKLVEQAKIYFGEPVAVIFARKNSIIVDQEGNQYYIDPE